MEGVRVRMYEVGFGDCFLVSLGNEDGVRHLLLDCGVHNQGRLPDSSGKARLQQVVEHIREDTGGELAVVIATHRHQDHISGFGKYLDDFRAFSDIGEVWLPWTENPEDPDAGGLRRRQRALFERIEKHRSACIEEAKKAGAAPPAPTPLDHLCENLAFNDDAMRALRQAFGKTQARIRYLSADTTFDEPAGIEGLRVRVLGPPRDPEYLRRMVPPVDQVYKLAPGLPGPSVFPFKDQWKAGSENARQYWVGRGGISRAELAQLEKELKDASENTLDAAFALDQAINNTSLSLLLSYQDQHLLLPGDAQWGNWMYWLEKTGAMDVLSRVTFLKVAHHGSQNATPRMALEEMSAQRFAAMVSTQSIPWPTIPQPELIEQLTTRSSGLARSDRAKAPRPFRVGPFWIEHGAEFPSKAAAPRPRRPMAAPGSRSAPHPAVPDGRTPRANPTVATAPPLVSPRTGRGSSRQPWVLTHPIQALTVLTRMFAGPHTPTRR